MIFTVDVKCPYCKTSNHLIYKDMKSTTDTSTRFCHADDGAGCGKRFLIDAHVTLNVEIYSICQA